MDPKMDSGFMMPEADAIVDNFDPLKSLLPAEIIGIMDQMLCLEVSLQFASIISLPAH